MRLILHNGWSKTGTTAFQNWLIRHQHLLIRQGILYPKTGRWPEGSHHALALALRPLHGYPSRFAAEELFKQLIDEIKYNNRDNRFHTLLLSSELFPELQHYPKILGMLNNLITRWELLTVIREQKSLITSMHYQLVNDVKIAFKGGAYELFEKQADHYLFYEIINKYQQQFDFDQVSVYAYDKQILSKLLNHLELPGVDLIGSRANVSSNALATKMVQFTNQLPMPAKQRIYFNNVIRIFTSLLPTYLSNLPKAINDDQAHKIEKYYSDSNKKLFTSYLATADPSGWNKIDSVN